MLRGGLISQAAVGPFFIVVKTPSIDLIRSIFQAQKPVLVQALLPKTAVERFDKGIVRGLARPGKIYDHPMGIGPQINFLGDELRAVEQLIAQLPIEALVVTVLPR